MSRGPVPSDGDSPNRSAHHRWDDEKLRTALDIVPTALDTEKLGKLLLAPAPIEAHCLSQAVRTF
jgi:hypothetical protein